MSFSLSVLLYTHDAEGAVLPAADVVSLLFPRSSYERRGRGTLARDGLPDRGDINVGTFERGTVVATRDALLFNPTRLDKRYLKAALGREAVLLAQRSYYDMFAFGHWIDGQLRRSISVNPVGKVWESIGEPEAFEAPFWAGERPAESGYPLPFHPLDMAETAVRTFLGVYLEGQPAAGLVGLDRVPLELFSRSSS